MTDLERKRFIALHWGQQVLIDPSISSDHPIKVNGIHIDHLSGDEYLLLKSLDQITDEDAIEAAKLAHQLKTDDWKVERGDRIVHVRHYIERYGETYHISMLYDYATVCANHHFDERDGDKAESFKVNIGEVQISSERPIPYIAIADFLRSRGYLLPFGKHSIEDIKEEGVVKT